MTKQLEPAIVRICTATRNYVGVGVLVSGKHVLTCAHVVADALKRSRTQQDQPTEAVYLDFPFIASGQILSAKVVFWRPVQLDLSVLSELGEDVALLELDEPTLSLKSTQLLLTNPSYLEKHSFQVFGLPKGNPQGVWADGIVVKQLANGWVQIENQAQAGFQVEPGFSGSPIWDTQLSTVIGITVATDPNRPGARVGFMIPTQELVRACPQLKEIGAIEKGTLGKIERPTKASDSEIPILYQKLESLLESEKWQEADRLTADIMLRLTEHSKNYLNKESILNLSQSNLSSIDYLWRTYSNDSFGFSIQRMVFFEYFDARFRGDAVPSLMPERFYWNDLGRILGWRREGLWFGRFAWKSWSELIFTREAPKGHLPAFCFLGKGGFWDKEVFIALFFRKDL